MFLNTTFGELTMSAGALTLVNLDPNDSFASHADPVPACGGLREIHISPLVGL